jgi:thymidylate kinase
LVRFVGIRFSQLFSFISFLYFCVVIYLSLTVEEAAKRGQYGEERYERVDFQKKVKEIFEKKLSNNKWKVKTKNKNKKHPNT